MANQPEKDMDIIIPVADGFEEIEAVTAADILRRTGLSVVLASDQTEVTGAHGLSIKPDISLSGIKKDWKAVVIPGGMPGAENLMKNPLVTELIRSVYEQEGYIAAICAGPIVPAAAGILKGKKVTCYPGFEEYLGGGIYTGQPVETDGRVITAEGPGAAMAFSLKLAEILAGKKTADEIKRSALIR